MTKLKQRITDLVMNYGASVDGQGFDVPELEETIEDLYALCSHRQLLLYKFKEMSKKAQ